MEEEKSTIIRRVPRRNRRYIRKSSYRMKPKY